jgi:hypothetical protein
VKSKAHGQFWTGYRALPVEIQKQAREKFRLWLKEPFNPTLHFKELISDVWSVRINQNHRALGRRRGNLIVWFWIGTHPEYDQLLKRLR